MIEKVDTASPGDAIMFEDRSVAFVLSRPVGGDDIQLFTSKGEESWMRITAIKAHLLAFTPADQVQHDGQSEIFVHQLISNKTSVKK